MVIFDRKKFLKKVKAEGYTRKELAAATGLSVATMTQAGCELPLGDIAAQQIASCLRVEVKDLIKERLM